MCFEDAQHMKNCDRSERKILRPAIFLDRDGTINVEVDFLSRVSDLALIEGAATAISRLAQAGFLIVVVTNQSGVARGYFDEHTVKSINSALAHMLEQGGARVDAWYYCPHHPEAGYPPYRTECSCRKPATGMVEQACQDLDIDIASSFVIGDSLRDMELAWNCGMGAVLVKTGHGTRTFHGLDQNTAPRIDFVATDITEASEWICRRVENRKNKIPHDSNAQFSKKEAVKVQGEDPDHKTKCHR